MAVGPSGSGTCTTGPIAAGCLSRCPPERFSLLLQLALSSGRTLVMSLVAREHIPLGSRHVRTAPYSSICYNAQDGKETITALSGGTSVHAYPKT